MIRLMLFIIIISFAFFSYFFKREKLNIYFLIVAIFLGFIAFHYIPNKEADLYRHFQALDIIRVRGLVATEDMFQFEGLPVFAYYFYIIGFLGDNRYLPAITVFLLYFFVFKLLYKISKKYEISKNNILLYFLLIVCTVNFVGAMSGVRNLLAFSVLAYCLYIDLVEKRKRIFCFVVYGGLCAFHPSAALFVVFRILLLLHNKFSSKAINVGLLLWTVFTNVFLQFMQKYSDSPFLNLFTTKTDYYTNERVYYDIMSITPRYMLMLMLVFLYIKFIKKFKDTEAYPTQYVNFLKMCFVFTIGSISNYDVFLRMTNFLVFFSSLFVLVLLENIDKPDFKAVSNTYVLNKSYNNGYSTIILISSALSLGYYLLSVYPYMAFEF